MSLTDLWNIHPSIFGSTHSVFVKYRGMSFTEFWKTRPYLDEFSKNWSVACPKILKLTIG